VNKLIGILFFYTVIFHNKEKKYKTEWRYIADYINEKANRYLNVSVAKNDWELLKIYLKDFPEPGSGDYLTTEQMLQMIDIFDKVFENTQYELRMYGIHEEEEKKTINEVFDNFKKYVDIVGTSNGVSIILTRWLSNCDIDRKLVERELAFIQLNI
jgi:hypothetical protein